MKPWQGYAHACVVALSVWFCRETIFEALQWWSGRSPSDGLILGFCILLIGMACIPIVAIHFSHVLVCIIIRYIVLSCLVFVIKGLSPFLKIVDFGLFIIACKPLCCQMLNN
jgi:hypothetical protein